jgi:prepilin-type N-terminal cleavage/methylation domain-containing protein
MHLLSKVHNLINTSRQSHNTRKRVLKSYKKGFSLPELIIVIAIFVIITSVALFNQGKLSSDVLLTNMAYEIGLSVREAQTYGIGVRGDDGGTTFAGQYGAHFSVQDDTSNRQVIVYSDKDDNGVYTPGEEKSIYSFQDRRGNRLVALCAGDLNDGEACTPTSAIAVPWLDIAFKRPNPAAIIYGPNATDGSPEIKSGRAYIVLNSLDNADCRVVIIESTGQIRVEDSSHGSCQNQ